VGLAKMPPPATRSSVAKTEKQPQRSPLADNNKENVKWTSNSMADESMLQEIVNRAVKAHLNAAGGVNADALAACQQQLAELVEQLSLDKARIAKLEAEQVELKAQLQTLAASRVPFSPAPGEAGVRLPPSIDGSVSSGDEDGFEPSPAVRRQAKKDGKRRQSAAAAADQQQQAGEVLDTLMFADQPAQTKRDANVLLSGIRGAVATAPADSNGGGEAAAAADASGGAPRAAIISELAGLLAAGCSGDAAAYDAAKAAAVSQLDAAVTGVAALKGGKVKVEFASAAVRQRYARQLRDAARARQASQPGQPAVYVDDDLTPLRQAVKRFSLPTLKRLQAKARTAPTEGGGVKVRLRKHRIETLGAHGWEPYAGPWYVSAMSDQLHDGGSRVPLALMAAVQRVLM
jgi:hypothetical protein